MNADIAERRCVGLSGIGEGQMVKHEVTLQMFHRFHLGTVHNIRLLLGNVHNSFQGCKSLRHISDAFAGRDHRPYQHPDIGIERHKLSQADGSVDGKISAVEQSQQAAGSDDQVQQRHKQSLKPDNAEVFLLVVFICHRKSGKLFVFLYKSLDHPDTGDCFLHLVGQIGKGFLLADKAPVHEFSVEIVSEDDQNQRQDGYACELYIHIEDHLSEHQYQHNCGVKGGDYRRSQKHADGLQVIGKVRHQVPGFMFIVIAHGQRLQMGEEVVAHFLFNGAGGSENKIAPEKTPQCNDGAKDQNPQDQSQNAVHVQGLRFQPVGDFSGVPRNIDIHKIHGKQGSNSQYILESMPLYIAADILQFLHIFSPSNFGGSLCRLPAV